MALRRCSQCGWKYPDYLLHTLHSSAGNNPQMCGICGLEISNKILTIQRTEFTGPLAEKLRQEAIAWRKQYPKHGPEITNGQASKSDA